MQERRAPMGGISKETFINPTSQTHERELLYDMLSCIDSKVKLNSEKIEKIKDRPAQCVEDFDRRYFKRLHAIIAGLMAISALVGYGFLNWQMVLEILK